MFFFFQAEDGIRDLTVTGVQTCALPIYNKYAISVPVEVQTAGGSVSKLVRNFPGLLVEEVDGCDPVASYDVLLRASEYVRQRKGPALVHAHVTRPYSHSLSDDEVLYKPPKEMEEHARHDCLTLF